MYGLGSNRVSDNARAAVTGVWELVSLGAYRGDTFSRYPLGEDARGRIFYSATGLMNAFLMRGDWGGRDMAELADQVLCYSGRWSVEGDEVFHDVDMATNNTFMGRRLTRKMQWADNGELILFSGDRAGSHRQLRWRRIDG